MSRRAAALFNVTEFEPLLAMSFGGLGAQGIFARVGIDQVEMTWTLSTASAGGNKRVTKFVICNCD